MDCEAQRSVLLCINGQFSLPFVLWHSEIWEERPRSISLLSNPMTSNFRFKAAARESNTSLSSVSAESEAEAVKKQEVINLGEGSEVIHIPRFLPLDESWNWFDYLDKEIPWTRPTIRVFGRSCLQVPIFEIFVFSTYFD